MEERRRNCTILVADDDRNVHISLNAYFRHEGYQILSAYDGKEAVSLALSKRPDIALIDIMMPEMDGFDVCAEIRKQSVMPIIMLTAKGEEFDKLRGLELGADDYITKPFSPRELLARIKAVLRRMHDPEDDGTGSTLKIGNLEIDMAAFTVRVGGTLIPCTPKETEILWTLARNPGMVFSREHLLESIWGYDYPGDVRAIDSHMKRIRAKLCLPGNDWDIRTVWGVGYRFELLANS
ncbi:MAG: response regulator transcription factor [Clostridiales bacterium]|nr:response regulator transcription factor [Clostridiales bacterium]